MSNYRDTAINPDTGKTEEADFLDGYYGRHRYGVRFDDGEVYPISDVRLWAIDCGGVARLRYNLIQNKDKEIGNGKVDHKIAPHNLYESRLLSLLALNRLGQAFNRLRVLRGGITKNQSKPLDSPV